MSYSFRVRKMPLPWDRHSGLTMKVRAFPLAFPSKYVLSSWYSTGSIQVKGKKSNSSGNFFLMRMRPLPSKFFLARLYMPGKWFIFWWSSILVKVSGWTALSVQQTSQSIVSAVFCRFHPNSLLTFRTTEYWQSKMRDDIPETLRTILLLFLLEAFFSFLHGEVGLWGSDSSDSDSYDLESSMKHS